MIDDIEDNYPEYLEDERGYTWDAWDVLPANVIRRHDAIVDSTAEELSRLDPAGLDDLDRWALARASRAVGDQERFLDATRLILASDEEHRGISYADVFVAAIEAFADEGLGDEAMLHLATLRERWPDDARATRLAVYVAARSGILETAVERALVDAAEDAELLYEIAEDLVVIAPRAAARILAKASAQAHAESRVSLQLDIELLRAKLPLNVDEEE